MNSKPRLLEAILMGGDLSLQDEGVGMGGIASPSWFRASDFHVRAFISELFYVR